MRHFTLRSGRATERRTIGGLYGEARDLRQRLARGIQDGVFFALVTLGVLSLLRGAYILAAIALTGLIAQVAVTALADSGDSKPGSRRMRRGSERSKRDGALRIKDGHIVRSRRFNQST